MEKVDIKFNNCYGIKNLEYSFDFKKRKNYLLYASNGMMKTSFTKIFKVLAAGKKPVDEIFARKTSYEIKVDNTDISKEQIFVISSYEDEYVSPNSAKLMVQKDLRAKYDIAVSNLAAARTVFYEKLQSFMGEDPVTLLAKFLKCSLIDVIDFLNQEIDKKLLEEKAFNLDFDIVKLSDIFNGDVEKFISDPKNLEQIKEYEKRYTELLENSPIFKRGIFSHNNAETISENLSSNGFFEAEHKLVLHGLEKEINSADSLSQTLKEEKDKIFSDEKLQKKFDKINGALGKRALIKFRSAIEANQEIIPQLSDFCAFERKVWISLLLRAKTELDSVINEFKKCQATIEEVKQQAKLERTQWDKVLDVFKTRFSAPFTIEVPNKDDVVFTDKMPEFIFKYVDSETKEESVIARRELEKVLSQGEKRALFLLNIINDLEALKLTGKDYLVITDDIAESFDYKNKYAIIEYLQEMMENEKFHFIILTHNFDFYRTVANRAQKLIFPQMVQRKLNGLEIVNPKYVFQNPFETIKKGMNRNDDKDIITSIPFVRNLIEYIKGTDSENYKVLTSLLHIKNDTKNITIKQLQDIYNEELKMEAALSFAKAREGQTVYKLIIDLAKRVSQDNRDTIDLTGKIIISMAIRLLAEDYMIDRLTKNGDKTLSTISGHQTGNLVKKYKEQFKSEQQSISTLDRVLLMSSENIHINSFMFEPLIDMSIRALIDLYGEVCILKQ